MGYAKIYNLYQDQRILAFAECFAMEKVHGTSAHVRLRDGNRLEYFSGGVQMEPFKALFNHEELLAKMIATGHQNLTVFGEAFGGKCQGFSHTYGPNLRFVAFDVEIGVASDEQRRQFLGVEEACRLVCGQLGLRFVNYNRIPTTMAAIDAERDRFSVEAMCVGISGKHGEGVVLRPIQEVRDARGNRICCKHKRDEFRETKSARKVAPTQEQLDAKLKDDELASEWVTEMRMTHVMDKLAAAGTVLDPKATGAVIAAMEADVVTESAGLGAEWNHAALRAVRKQAAALYQKMMPKVVL